MEADGVYAIWCEEETPVAIRVGHRVVMYALGAHKEDPCILAYCLDELYVTWAYVNQCEYQGIERYSSEQLKPRTIMFLPDAISIAVNLPWPVLEKAMARQSHELQINS